MGGDPWQDHGVARWIKPEKIARLSSLRPETSQHVQRSGGDSGRRPGPGYTPTAR